VPVYIALFRGINVGGKNKISMKSLTGLLEASGYVGVRTYIQSGNVLFQSTPSKAVNFMRDIGKAIKDNHGFHPSIIVLDVKELDKAICANPFPDAEGNPKSLHLYFLTHTPKQPDLERLNQVKSASESFQLIGNVFYLYAPDGVGRSKLAAQVEKLVGVKATARNWNTVTKLLEMTHDY